MKFGIIDHLDRGVVPLDQHYRTRMRLICEYEKSGWFHNYQLTEHHGTPLGMAPSPSVFLAAVAERTSRMRIGSLVFTLPMYHPYRLYEEICMLDNLSAGRLDIGVGRGASPIEMKFLNIDIKDADDYYEEALDVIMQCFTSDRLTYTGKRFSFENVPMAIRPLQSPHPPLWYGMNSENRIPWAVANRVNVMTNSDAQHARGLHDAYRRAWLEAGNDPGDFPFFGGGKHVIVAKTDAQARKLAATAYKMYSDHTTLLSKQYGYSRIRSWVEDIDEAIAAGILFIGSPETVRDGLIKFVRESGSNYLSVRPAFGDLTFEQSMETLHHLTETVFPALLDDVRSPASSKSQHGFHCSWSVDRAAGTAVVSLRIFARSLACVR